MIPDIEILMMYQKKLGSLNEARRVYSGIYVIANRTRNFIYSEWFQMQFAERHILVGHRLIAEGLITLGVKS